MFFTFYVSSGMVAGGRFFEASFGVDYRLGMVLVAGITVLYTLVGRLPRGRLHRTWCRGS